MTKLKLNANQIKFMLDHWFEPYEIYNIFDTISIDWLYKQEFEIRDLDNTFASVFMNGLQYTTIRTTGECADWLDELKNIK